MARIRTVKPEFWQNEELAEVSEPARLIALGVLNLSDDEGWFKAHPRLVEAALFPLTEPSLSTHECLKQLCAIGYLEVRTGTDGKDYAKVVKFTAHQKVNRPTPSKIRPLAEFSELSVSYHGALTGGKEGKGKEGNREQGMEGKLITEPSNKFDLLFDKFWSAGMKKTGKKASWPIFRRILSKQPDPEDFTEKLCADIRMRLSTGQLGFTELHPQTYLNGERWEDAEPVAPVSPQQMQHNARQAELAALDNQQFGGNVYEAEKFNDQPGLLLEQGP